MRPNANFAGATGCPVYLRGPIRRREGGGGGAHVNNAFFTLENSKFLRHDAGPGDGGALELTV